MFDWNDQDQVGDTIWSQFTESEDHIVPYPTALESTENISGARNDFPRCNQENNSVFNSNEEISASRLDMGSWPDLPSLSSAFGKSYNDLDDQDSIATELLNDFSEAPNLNQTRVQLDAELEMLDDKETDSFLDCDWANIGDLDDLDRIFSNNDSTFGHEMVGSAGEFLSSSSDIISNTAQSILMPTTDTSIKSSEQADSKAYIIGENHGVHNQFLEKVDSQRCLLKSYRKLEERVKGNDSKTSTGVFSSITGSQKFSSPSMHSLIKTSFQTSQTLVSTEQRQISGFDVMEQIGSSNQYLFSGYGYAAYPFPANSFLHDVNIKSNQEKPAAVGPKGFPETSKHSSCLNKPPDVASRPSMMTPQEKIEKLRRRQQMQAKIAIQQQQQQFGHENDKLTPNNSQEPMTSAVVEDSSKQLSSSDLYMLADQDESQKASSVVDDQSIQEHIYDQLQYVLAKMDTRIRLCIRESLFRLAQSAVERQSASDRSSTNRSNKDEDKFPSFDETKRPCRNAKLPEAETGTNHIDRTVAHLLFHKPSESFRRHVTEEMPHSPTMFNPASNASLDSPASTSEENQNIEEMEVQPPI